MLAKGGAATPDELDRARQDREAAKATFEAADARRRSASSGARYEDVLVARSELSAAEARRDEAAVTLERLTIRAPWKGTVLQLKFRVGERYSPEKGAFAVLGDTTRLVARVDVDERDLAKLKVGSSAFITVPAQPGRRVSGRVTEIGRHMGRKNVRTDDPVERIDTKILEVVVALDDRDGLVPGLRVVGYVRE
jgi:multidrug resistance efflux pump